MARQKVRTILVVVLGFAWAATAGFAQTQATTTSRTPASGDQEPSAAALAQEAANPFSSSWLMQIEQNNNWMDMPVGEGTRVQNNLLFQPLMSVALSEERGCGSSRERPLLIRRPRRTHGRVRRQVLAWPRRDLCSAAGSAQALIAYAFVQQWFKWHLRSDDRLERSADVEDLPTLFQVQGRWAGVVATGDAPAVVSMPATVESTALQPRIDALRAILPEPRIRLGERVNFDVGELEAPVAQRLEGFDRPLEKGGAKLLVRQNLPNDELHGSLHIYTPESSPVLGASSVAVLPVFRSAALLVMARATRLPPCDRRKRPKNDEAACGGGLNPSGSTRHARQRATGGAPATATGRRRAGGGKGRLAL